MANVLLAFFVPSSKPLCSKDSGFGLVSSLVLDLQRLHKSLENNVPSLQWCSEALLVVKETHTHFLHYLKTSLEGTNMVDEYMSVSLELLDLCNLLKAAVSSLDRYRMMVDFMDRRLKDGASFATASSKIELQRVEIEQSNYLVKFKKCKEMKLKNGGSKVKLKTQTNNNNNMNVLQPIWSIMSTISLFIFCSIIHPIPASADQGFYSETRDSDFLTKSVQKLNRTSGEKFKHVQSKSKPIFQENQMIEDAFAAIKAEIVVAKEVSEDEGRLSAESLAMLKNRSLSLKDGIDLFESVVNELFEDVIKARTMMIELITFNNHITYC